MNLLVNKDEIKVLQSLDVRFFNGVGLHYLLNLHPDTFGLFNVRRHKIGGYDIYRDSIPNIGDPAPGRRGILRPLEYWLKYYNISLNE